MAGIGDAVGTLKRVCRARTTVLSSPGIHMGLVLVPYCLRIGEIMQKVSLGPLSISRRAQSVFACPSSLVIFSSSSSSCRSFNSCGVENLKTPVYIARQRSIQSTLQHTSP